MQVADVFPGLEDDRRIFFLAGEMIEVDQQLEVRVVDRLHQVQSLTRGVDDVGFLAAERFDHDGDAVLSGFRTNQLPEGDKLLEGFLLWEALRHPTRAAAPETDDLHAEPIEAGEGFLDVGQLLFLIGGLRSRQPDASRDK